MLDGAFQYRTSVAEQTGVLQPTYTAPDDGLLSSVVPMHSAKNLTAFSADGYLSEAVIAAEGLKFSALSRRILKNGLFFIHLSFRLLQSEGNKILPWDTLRGNLVKSELY